ncbi:Pentatricopeptide repeat-containing protein, mitochondrial [Ananas comosus]|uniref:Pentatricopeptide repeat-containing protein, mitochondrial n=1 Tax=Ananas comosus TaxID=4615 RepID=A0A199USS0_ANACO|nr:Pentatricopeptide repeat-containing protein, mitochondrial [Ananas comosus]
MLDLRLRPSLPAYTSLLRLYCSRRQLPQAQALLSTLPSLGYRLDVVAHTVFLDGLCAAGRFRDVEKLLAQSRADGWEPNSVTYNVYASALCRAGQLDEAFRQVGLMRDRGLRPTIETLNILFDCLCRESKVSEAKRLLEGSDALGWVVDSFFYNTLMSRLFDVGELDAVLELLASMFKKGIPPDACTFTVVIRTLCKSGKLAEARNVVERGGSFVASDVVMFNTLLHGFYAAGNVEEVRLVYEEMLGKSVVPNNFTYCIVMDSFCRRGKFLEATSFLLGSFAEDGFSLDLVARLNSWFVKYGKLREILNLLDEMSRRGFAADGFILTSLITAFCREGYCGSLDFYKEDLNGIVHGNLFSLLEKDERQTMKYLASPAGRVRILFFF